MIEFKPVRLEDRAVIERYTMPSGICNCDLAFANMYCWQAVFHSAWAEIGGFLVIRFQIDGGERIGYMQPVGEGDFGPILPLLREDAHAHGQRLRIIGLTDEGRDTIRRIVPCHFAFESDRALEDYVYNADDLRNLAGRRYQPKRNHINRFTAEYPDYRYEELTPDRFFGVLDWGRGVWTYHNTWYWGSASGELDGVPFGWNIGYGFGNTEAATENVLFYDGRVHKLSEVRFEIPMDEDGFEDFMKPWVFTSDDNRFYMNFTPVLDRSAFMSAGVVLSDQHQVFGRFTGRITLDDGTVLPVRDFFGFAEKVENKW